MTTRTPGFVGLDLETTGLNPDYDHILELGIVLLDDRMQPITAKSWITATADEVEDMEMDPTARKMHITNGLLADIAAGKGRYRAAAEMEAIIFLQHNDATDLPMLGSSITFDRSFLARHMPSLLNVIQYRSVDATSINLARRAVTPRSAAAWRQMLQEHAVDTRVQAYRKQLGLEGEHVPHRTIDDVLMSAALAYEAILSPFHTNPAPERPEAAEDLDRMEEFVRGEGQ